MHYLRIRNSICLIKNSSYLKNNSYNEWEEIGNSKKNSTLKQNLVKIGNNISLNHNNTKNNLFKKKNSICIKKLNYKITNQKKKIFETGINLKSKSLVKNIVKNSKEDWKYNNDILKKILKNKITKKYDELIIKFNYENFIKSIYALEKHTYQNINFFEIIKKKFKINQLKDFLLKFENNKILKELIFFWKDLYLFIENHIIINFEKSKDNSTFNIKNLFYDINNWYKNKKTNDRNFSEKNDIIYFFNNYKNKLKKWNSLDEKKYIVVNKILIKNNNLEKLEEDFKKLDLKKCIKGNYSTAEFNIMKNKESKIIKTKKKIKKMILEKKIINYNKKEIKVEIKLDKINLKQKLLVDIFNNNFESYGILYYIKILKFMKEKIDFGEICSYNKILDKKFLEEIFYCYDNLSDNINVKDRKKSYFNNRFQQVLGMEYSNFNKINDIKIKLIKKFIFNKNGKKIYNINKEKIFDKNFLIKKILRLFTEKIKNFFDNPSNNFKLDECLNIYFGVIDSVEIIENNNIKNDFLNFSFFKKFIKKSY